MAKAATTTTDRQACCAPLLATPLTDDDAEELARGFHALADPARLRLLSLIAAQADGEVCACELVEPLGKSQPTVSHHLKVLYEAGLVDREKRGTWVWYWVVRVRLKVSPGAANGYIVDAGSLGEWSRPRT